MRTSLIGRTAVLDRARESTTDRAGVLFIGEPAVGKTRLLAEVLELLAARNWYVERFVASTSARDIPFGSLISLLPDGAIDRTQQVAGVRRTLIERAQGRPTVLAVDDAHLLDEASLACLVDLVHHSDVVFLGTARSTEPSPPDLTTLWISEGVQRIEVEPLDRSDTAELAHQILGEPISDDLADQLWDRTRGLPLFVRELLLDAMAQKLIALDAGMWSLHRDLRTGARLQELVGARLAHISDPAHRLLELLALAEPLAVDLLTPDEGSQLDHLERRGLAKGEHHAGRWVALVEHPLITEAVANAVPTRRRIEVLRDVGARMVEAGFPAPGDALRTAAWHQECGDPLPLSAGLAAGREALASLALDRACELAQATVDEAPLEGNLLLGEVLRLQARAAEAEQALAIVAELDIDDETIVRVAMWRSTLRAHHADDPEGAMALLDAAADRVSNPESAFELRSEAAFLAGVLGRFDVAVNTNRRILAAPGLTDSARWTAMMNLLFGQVMLADLTKIDEPVDAMANMLDEIGPTRPEGVDLYWALVSSVYILRGELARCESELVPHVQRCVASEQMHGLTAAILAYPLLFRGSPHAMTIATAACEATAQTDAYMVGPIAQAGLTIAHTISGDLDGARDALAAVDRSHTGDLRLDSFIGRAQAAVASLEGGFDEAARIVADAGRLCIADSYVNFGAVALYDAVRCGRADLVVEDLRPLAGPNAAPLIDVMVAHAVAQHNGDADTIVDVATALANMGARNLAAEALDDAARIFTDEVSSGRASTAAALWRRATLVPNARALPAPCPVSEREMDVVELALAGHTSKAIAEALFLSVRTVDNHLAQVYRKLDVAGRSDLAEALAPLPLTS
ncbi:MAG: AAA family ATPase [Acidimicrobiales bacterium]|nr:AAA family ATPase [Acidimicrobiales bacterium]